MPRVDRARLILAVLSTQEWDQTRFANVRTRLDDIVLMGDVVMF